MAADVVTQRANAAAALQRFGVSEDLARTVARRLSGKLARDLAEQLVLADRNALRPPEAPQTP